MLKRFDIKINHDMGECLYTVDAKSSKIAIDTVEEEWHKDHKGYKGTSPKFTVDKTYTHAEKKALGGLLLALVGGMYLYKVYSNKTQTAKEKESLEKYQSESAKYAKSSSRRKVKDPDDMFQAGEARRAKRDKSKEVADIYENGGKTSKLLAPNGNPSNLTPEQWRLVRAPEFKQWFGDWENDPDNASKVVDENGEPLVMYSGSPKKFTVFESQEASFDRDDKEYKPRFWFIRDREWAENYSRKATGFVESVYECFLNIRDPKFEFNLYLDDENDGSIQYHPRRSVWVAIATTSNQIKLADGSNTTFDGENPDIRFAKGGKTSKLLAPNGKPSNLTPEQWRLVRSPEFKRWFGDWENDARNASKVVDSNGEPLLVYHGSRSEVLKPFSVFDEPKEGIFFSSDKHTSAWFSDGNTANLFFDDLVIPKDLNTLESLEKFYKQKIDSTAKVLELKEDGKTWFYRFETYNGDVSSPLGKTKTEAIKNLKKKLEFYPSYEKNRKKRPFYRCFLNIRKPLVVDAKNRYFYEIEFEGETLHATNITEYVHELKKHDGVIMNNVIEGLGAKNVSDSYVVFKSNQIKLAEGTNTMFNEKNPDIRFAKGGNVRILESQNERLSRPNGSMESEVLSRVHYDETLFVGNFGWRTPNGKIAEGYLYALDDFDKNLVNKLRLKEGEKIYRYFNRTTAVGGITPMIKINVDKGLLYFPEHTDTDEIMFETRGIKAEWLSLIKEKYANGGTVSPSGKKIYWFDPFDAFEENGVITIYHRQFHRADKSYSYTKIEEASDYKNAKFKIDYMRKGLDCGFHTLDSRPDPIQMYDNFYSPCGQNLGKSKALAVKKYDYMRKGAKYGEGYAKGGTLKENLTKELHRLQKDLMSSRLTHYREGDTSENEMARQRERDSKMTRMDEVLQLLNQMEKKYAKGGGTSKGWEMPKKMTNQEIVDFLKDYKYAVVRPLNFGAMSMDSLLYAPHGRSMGYIRFLTKDRADAKEFLVELHVSDAEGGQKLQGKVIELTPKNIYEILLQTNYMYTKYENGGMFDSEEYANGGMIDLFEDYENIPASLQEVLDDYNEAFEDGDYSGLKDALKAVESIGYTFEFGLDGEAYGLRPKTTRLSQLQGYEDSDEFAKGGSVVSMSYDRYVDAKYKEYKKAGYDDLEAYDTAFRDLGLELEGLFDKKQFDDMLLKRGAQMKKAWNEYKKFAEVYVEDGNYVNPYQTDVYALGGQTSGIKVGDWVTLKSDGKRYKVKRVLNNNMIEITAGATTLLVSINDVDTNVKFYRSKFNPVPKNVEVKFKIGDRVKFNTKKGITEVGKVLLYKYIPTQNTIIYTIATDSGWKASVLQENLSSEYTTFTIPAESTSPSPSTAKAPKAPKPATAPQTYTSFTIPAEKSLTVGGNFEVVGSPNLTGTITKLLPSTNEVEVMLSDSMGLVVKKGKSIPFKFEQSKIKMV